MRMASILVIETSVTNNSPISGPQSPTLSFSIKVCYSWVQTIFLYMKKKLTGTSIETTYRKRFPYLYVSIINHISTGVRPNYNNITTFVYGP